MSNRLTALLSKETRREIKDLADVAGSYNAAFEYLLSLRRTIYKTGKQWAELGAMEAVYKHGHVSAGALRTITGCGAAACKVVAQSYTDEPLNLQGAGDTKRLYFRFTQKVADQLEALLSYGENWERLCRYLLALQSPRFDGGALHAERVLKQMILHGDKVTSYTLSMECTNASLYSATKVFNDYKEIIKKL